MIDAFPRLFRGFLVLAAGGLFMATLPSLMVAIAAPGVPLLWWTARALGLVAYVALWLTSLFGVLLSSRGGGRFDIATIVELHNRWALAAIVATALHVLAVVGDPVSGVTPLAVAIPLASAKLTGPVALGSLALWAMAIIALSTALARHLPRWIWRAVHVSAFGTLVLALVHGLSAGTDTSEPLVRGLYLATAALMLGAVTQRLLLAWRDGSTPRQRRVRVTESTRGTTTDSASPSTRSKPHVPAC